jgi:intracellular sulfur oxidation DsrE/DsrF family protein
MLAVILATLGVGAVQAGSEAPAGYYADQKVVYHNGGGGPEGTTYFEPLLGNLRNHVEAVGKEHVEIRVVSLGDGVALFQSAANDKELAARIDARKVVGVRFLVCVNTLRERKIRRDRLYGVVEDDVVPSGFAELARLQGMEFAYFHP